jgi:acetolactate synthase-1/2/3 large subunit
MSNWVEQCNKWKHSWDGEKKYFRNWLNDDYFNIYQVIDVLNEYSFSNNIFITDTGSASFALPVNITLKEGQSIISSQSQSDMGWALPASIGVALSAPEKVPLVLVGDGSFMSNIQELAVIKEYKLPIKILMLNNNGYLTIRNTQKNFYGNRVYGVSNTTGLYFPPCDKISKTFGLNYEKVYCNSGKYSRLADIFSNNLPYIVEFMCRENEEIVPSQNFKTMDGKKIQCPLDDMYPFMSDEELNIERNRI